jgi:hypothetical protein
MFFVFHEQKDGKKQENEDAFTRIIRRQVERESKSERARESTVSFAKMCAEVVNEREREMGGGGRGGRERERERERWRRRECVNVCVCVREREYRFILFA